MARILIQPEDLARLARRFDAAADELARSGRRLSRSRSEVRLNQADDTFPVARFAERSALVEGNLRRLAAEFRVDAGLMARTVDDAGVDGDADWTLGLLSAAASGVGAGVGPAIGAAGPAVGTLTSVVNGLMSLGAGRPPAEGVVSASTRPIGGGGLFALPSAGRGGQEMLVRLTERLAESSWNTATETGAPDEVAGAVWTRIVGELFAGDDVG